MAIEALEKVIDAFGRLPGVGRKSATRLAFHILNSSLEEVESFSQALLDAKKLIKKCSICGDLSEKDTCPICSDEFRDRHSICVVEDSRDVISFEKTGKYRGKYHVLGGKLAPLKGITPDKLNLESLLKRVAQDDISEIIIALNPDLEGETTTLYLTKLLKPFHVKITRIASGIPMGGNIEYADSATISRALEGRQEIE
ncbi:MAG: recombination mediator RecR [Fusobacteriaceae bacterium]